MSTANQPVKRRRASPLLIGSFVVGALLLLAGVLITFAGNQIFARKERAVMHFSGSVYGLQVGAPVVFRGVRVGSVASIEVIYDRQADRFSIPVVAELEADAVSGMDGKPAGDEAALALPALVKRGLTAQLQMQSLLTGLLYIDLDLRPQVRSASNGTGRGTSNNRGIYRNAVEIPTTATAIQALKNQIDGMDFRRLADDLSAIAASARAMVAGPELKQALTDLTAITGSVRHLSQRLDQRIDPMADDLQRTLAGVRTALQQLGQAAQGVDRQAERFGNASDRVGALLAPDSPLVLNLQRSADEVAKSAASLRQATAGDAPLVRNTERAMQDLSRAARALRDLAEALEQQPESLLRGRGEQR